jgi:4-hydroxybenzoate polyprenyltransferase
VEGKLDIFNGAFVKYKKYTLFFIAALSLLLSGVLIGESIDYKELTLLGFSSVLGVFWVYRVNDVIDYDEDLKFNLKYFFKNKYHVLYSLLILILIVFGTFLFSLFRFQIFAFVGLLGFVYSINFQLFGKVFRLKNIFFFKNLSIGLAWGALVVIGSGSLNSNSILMLTLLTVVQVFIGSMIRDIPDREKDMKQNVQSFPVVIGVKKTILFMHVANLSSLLILFIDSFSMSSFVLIVVVVFWRLVNLVMLQKKPLSSFWGQFFNLMTCTLIFAVILIDKLWS